MMTGKRKEKRTKKMRKKAGKITLSALLAVSLLCGMTGCGKTDSGAAADLTGMSGNGQSLDLAGMSGGGDAVDLTGGSGGGDAVDLTGGSGGGDAVDLSGTSESGGSGDRQAVDEDFVIVKVPTISYEDFGNGFYDEYAVDYEPLLEKTYDEDGLLTGARLYFTDMLDPKDARITLSYEKSGGMVSACNISTDDMYAWYMYGGDSIRSDDLARDDADTLQGRMPYRVEFREPVAADPDAVKEAVIAGIEDTETELHNALIPPLALDFFEAFNTMYLQAFSAFGDTGQTGQAEEDGLKVSYDEDGLLTEARINFQMESGETVESWITVRYEREGGQVTGCEINGDLYSFFVCEFGCDEESAKGWSEELLGKVPVKLVFDEPVDPDPGVMMDWILRKMEENLSSDADGAFLEAFLTIYDEYSSGSTQGTADQVDIGGSIEARFRKRMNGNDLAANYFGGGLGGEKRINNDPGWTIDMPVSHEEIICRIETEQDSNGNITLVHLYNDYASYDYVFTYDSTGRMVRYDQYEYPKGQSREAVGVKLYTQYSYDGQGRLTKRETLGTQANRVDSATEYYYDDMGRIAARIDTANYVGNDFMTMQQTYSTVTQSYEYDDTGKVILVSVTVDWARTPAHVEPPAPTTVMYLPAR